MTRLIILLTLLFPVLALGQTISVTATITDSDSQTWNNGSWSVQVYSPNGVPNYNGTPVPTNIQSGTLSSSGALAVTLYNTSTITPLGAQYQWTLCSQTSAPCSSFLSPVTATNMSSTLSALVTAPRFSAAPIAFGYLDVEVATVPQIGGQYFNVTNLVYRVWNGSAWQNNGGGSGSMTWPNTPGITVCTGTPCTAWAASLTAPAGAIVGTTDTQTLTNKTVNGVTPTTFGFIDPTSSIQAQLNAKSAWPATAGIAVCTGSPCTAWTTSLTAPTSTIVGINDTQTLTNKRITKRTGTTTSSATPTINTDTVNFYSLTAQAVAITSFTTNLTGTPTNAQVFWVAITDNGTPQTIAWGTSFEASTVALPTTTVASTRLDIGFVWNSVTSKWRCVAVS